MSGAPIIPSDLRGYDSYKTDPLYAQYFTIAYCSFIAVSIIFTFPSFLHNLRRFVSAKLWTGISDNLSSHRRGADHVSWSNFPLRNHPIVRKVRITLSAIFGRYFLYTPVWPNFIPQSWRVAKEDCCRRSYMPVSVGQILLIAAYLTAVIAFATTGGGVNLRENSNRAGFMALAQLPLVFLISTKNSLLGFFLGGKGYEKLNFIHRWTGRAIFICVLLHGALWTSQYVSSNKSEIIFEAGSKGSIGVIAFSFLLLMVLSSLPQIRRKAYTIFYTLHMVCLLAFFIAVCYHTPYASPYIYPCVAFFASDVAVRLFRVRVKDCILQSSAAGTKITVQNVTGGWYPTQHAWVRVLYGSVRQFESHPLSILNSCYDGTGSLELFAKNSGDWTRELCKSVGLEGGKMRCMLLLDGPYGGLVPHPDETELLILLAGGSGLTFTIGCLSDLIERLGSRSRLKVIRWVLITRSHVDILPHIGILERAQSTLRGLGVDVMIEIYFTFGKAKDMSNNIPSGSWTFHDSRPDIEELIQDLLTTASNPVSDIQKGAEKQNVTINMNHKTSSARLDRGCAIVTSGPHSLVCEVQNASIATPVYLQRKIGGLSCYVEAFTL